MKRMKVNKRRDRKIFKKTASKGKALNLGVVNSRGGIRL